MSRIHVDPAPFAEFSHFVAEQKQKHTGQDIAGNTNPYIPRAVLQEYWTNLRISKVLQAHSPTISAKAIIIKQRYIQIFSILVYIDGVRHLDKFTSQSLDDSNLPLKKPPTEWPVDRHHEQLFDAFAPEQWVFCPLDFIDHQLQNRDLPSELILPIEQFDMIQLEDVAMVQKFVINDACNHLVPKENGCPIQRVFVLKTYHNNKFESLYDNERKALTMLMNIPSENIITYYGSFRQHGTFNLILEYADRGSLADLLDKIPPPSTAKDILQFWYSLFTTLYGLRSIHQWMEPDDDNRIRGIHEDIKPDNILLFEGRSGSSYDFIPKVADFGLFSHVRRSRTDSSEAKGLDNHGNQRYSSPECSNNTARVQKGPNWITPKADIFSFGALVSDCAAWVVGGNDLRATYLKKRLSHHAKENTFQSNGYDGCFHDGVERLPVIDLFHEEIHRLCHHFDHITPRIVDLVQNHMLLGNPTTRFNAQQISAKFANILRSSDPSLYSSYISLMAPEVVLPPLSSAPMSLTLPTTCTADKSDTSVDDEEMTGTATLCDGTRTIRPELRITPCERPSIDIEHPVNQPSSQYRDSGCGSSQVSIPAENPLSGNPINLDPPQTSGSYSPLGGRDKDFNADMLGRHREAMKSGEDPDPLAQEVVEFILHNLSQRDQFFFIDDSISMKQHAPVVEKTFLSLSWLAKRLDPDKLELSFISKPQNVIKAKKTKKLFKHVATHHYLGEKTFMEKNFGYLVDNFLIPRLPWKFMGFNCNPWARNRQMSVYIFTDGNWGNDPGVDRPLRRLMDSIRKRGLDRSQVSLHFIRFGSLPIGKKHLDFLDEYGRKENWDIVDVKDISNPVIDIFMGPISPEVDNRG